MPQMALTSRLVNDQFAVECETPKGLLKFDGDKGTTGPTPMMHLLAAAGACALMDVSHILRKKRLTFSDLRVECIGERPEGYPSPFTAIRLVFHVKGDVAPAVLADAAKLSVEKYCNIRATLALSPPVSIEAQVD